MSPSDIECSAPGGISRRLFVAGVGALAITARLGSAKSLAQTVASPGSEPLSIGYISGSGAQLLPPQWSDGDEFRVVPVRFARGPSLKGLVRVTVHGLYPAKPRMLGDQSLWVDALVANPAAASDLPVYLWTHRASLNSTSPGAGLTLATGTGFALVTTRLKGDVVESERSTSFGGNGMQLKRGVYLLGLSQATWRRPAALQHGHVDAKHGSVLVTIDDA